MWILSLFGCPWITDADVCVQAAENGTPCDTGATPPDDSASPSTDDTACAAVTWYGDSDADSFGGETFTIEACEQPSGYVDNHTDCDDNDKAVNPDADELCDTVDQDCDDAIDEEPLDGTTWFVDQDGDGFGGEDTVVACDQPDGAYPDSDDCDDTDKAIHPAADEVWGDEVDQDCDGALVAGSLHGTLDDPTADAMVFDGFPTAIDCDLDGDGTPELVTQDADGGRNHENAGAIHIHEGPVSPKSVPSEVQGDESGDYLGLYGRCAGDLNDDGLDDLLVWSIAEGGSHYTLHVVGAPTKEHAYVGDVEHARLSRSAYYSSAYADEAAGSDLDGDGYAELITGYGLGGSTVIVEGPLAGNTAPWEEAEHVRVYGNEDLAAGSQVGWLDHHADGIDDLMLLGDASDGKDGFVVLDGRKGLLDGGDLSIDDADFSIGGLTDLAAPIPGDFDGDGYDDLVFLYVYTSGGTAYELLFVAGEELDVIGKQLSTWDKLQTVVVSEGVALAPQTTGDLDADGDQDLIFAAGDTTTRILYGPFDGALDLDAIGTDEAHAALGDVSYSVSGGSVAGEDLFEDLLFAGPADTVTNGTSFLLLGGP